MFKANNEPGPLHQVKVLDLTVAMAGPLATARMGDLGADVIKVESPSGDFSRHWPFAGYIHGGESSAYLAINRNKRSIVIDLKKEKGLEVLHSLVKESDILVQNFRPRVAKKLNFDFETLRELNPKLVYISISGYGDKGYMIDRPGQDLLAQSFSGLTFNGGESDGMPCASPVYIADICASHLAVQAALSGYIEALRTGKGQHMKVSLLSAAMELQIQELTTYLTSGQRPYRSNNYVVSKWMEPPYNIYRTKDGWIAIAQATFKDLADTFQDTEIERIGSERPDIKDKDEYCKWRDKIIDIVTEKFLDNTTAYWIEKMTNAGIWVGPVRTYEEIKEDEFMQNFFMEVEHPQGGPYITTAPSITAENLPQCSYAPLFGEHTAPILKELGFSSDEIEQYYQEEIIK